MKNIKSLRKDVMRWLRKPSTLILIAIIVIGLLLRVTNTPDRFGSDKDPTRDALIAIYGAESLQFPLIGPHSGIAGFTFGPWYYYELILIKLIFVHPFAPFYFIIFLSVLFIAMMYVLGKVVKDETLGLILAGLAAYSPAQTGASNGLSNPNLVSVHAAVALIIFFLFIKEKIHPLWSLLWGLVIGIGINHHYQMFPLIILPVIAYLDKWKTLLKQGSMFALGIVIAFLPLFIFNILHDWHTVRGFITFSLSGGTSYIPNSWMIYLKDFWPQFWAYMLGTPLWVGLLLGGVVGVIHLWLLWKRKLTKGYLLTLSISFILFVVLRYYRGNREYYYLFYLHPFLFLFLGMTLRIFWHKTFGKVLVCMIGIILFIFAWKPNMTTLADNDETLGLAREAQALTMKLPDETFSVVSCRDILPHHPQALAFFLSMTKDLSENGKKVGIIDDPSACILPPHSGEEIIDGIYDFSRVSEQDMEKNGWLIVSPRTVYERTLLWADK